MFIDLLFDLPSSLEVLFDDEGISTLDGERFSTVGSDYDLALDKVNELKACVRGVICAHRGFPGSAECFIRGVLDPSCHRWFAFHFFPTIQVRLNRRRLLVSKRYESRHDASLVYLARCSFVSFPQRCRDATLPQISGKLTKSESRCTDSHFKRQPALSVQYEVSKIMR